MGRWFRKDMQLDWRDRIKPGDVLLERGKSPRVVRTVTYRPNGFLVAVNFTIKRCSWTGRCYTTVCRTDLGWRKFAPAGVTVKTVTDMDKMILRDIETPGPRTLYALDCCDVRGIV